MKPMSNLHDLPPTLCHRDLMLATPGKLCSAAGWLYELKYDGFRRAMLRNSRRSQKSALNSSAFLVLVGALALVILGHPAAGAQMSGPQPRWAALTAEQKQILQPLEREWDGLPDYQRQRLLATAERYRRLSPKQQQRFSSRLLDWSKLTHEQRDAARKRYEEFQALLPQERLIIQKRWKERQSAQKNESVEEALPSTPQPAEPPSNSDDARDNNTK